MIVLMHSSALTFLTCLNVVSSRPKYRTEDSLDRDARLKDRIEDADFSALDWKLDGYEIDEDLKKLLYSL